MSDLSKLPPPPKGQTGISPEVFSHLPPPPKGQVGLTLDQIKPSAPLKAVGAQLPATPPQQDSTYLSRVGEDFAQRRSAVGEANQRQATGQQTMPETILQHAGQIAGGAFDFINEVPAVRSAVGAFGSGVNALSQTAPIKAVGDFVEPAVTGAMNKWDGLSPRAKANISSVGNIASILPAGKGAETALKPIGSIAGETLTTVGKTLEKSGIASAKEQTATFARELTRPIEDKATKLAEVPRTTETGIFNKDVVAPTVTEQRMADEVAKLPVSKGNTYQKNYSIIQDANRVEAQTLETAIGANDFVLPRKETISRLKTAQADLATSPTVVGDAQVTAGRLLDGAIKIVNENPSTGKGLLNAKKQYDSWVLSQKPKAFDGATENAFTLANRQVRNVFKDILDEKAPNAEVKKSLARQTSLYDAMENVAPKAADEANTIIGRKMQQIGQKLGTRNKVVQGLAAATGIGVFGAATAYAAPLTIATGAGWVMYKAGKLVLKPQVRIELGKALQGVGGVLNPEEKTYIQGLLSQYTDTPNKQGGFIQSPLGGENPNKGLPQSKPAQPIEKVSLQNDTTSSRVVNDSLSTEALKYPNAEDFVKAGVYSPARDSVVRNSIRTEVANMTENRPINLLKENPNNPPLDKSTINIKAEDIATKKPYILVDGNTIIDGHHTFEAYKKAGIENVPVIDKSQLTDIYNQAHKKSPFPPKK